MFDPRQIASQLVGAVDWQSAVSGFCKCPGEALHTSRTGKKDCRVNVDGAPTIYCFHASCAHAVADANKRLRRELNASPWTLTLPDEHWGWVGLVREQKKAPAVWPGLNQAAAGWAAVAGGRWAAGRGLVTPAMKRWASLVALSSERHG